MKIHFIQRYICAFLASLQPFLSLPAWALAGPSLEPKTKAESGVPCGPRDDLAPPVSATPVCSTAPILPKFSQPPKDEEFALVSCLPLALVPSGATTSEENQALADALTRRPMDSGAGDEDALVSFLEQFPDSAWRASLLCGIGKALRQKGFFSQAVVHLGNAWDLSEGSDSLGLRVVADEALAELLQLHLWKGDTNSFDALATKTAERPVLGGARERVLMARQARASLTNDTMVGSCGSAALQRILSAVPGGHPTALVVPPDKIKTYLSLSELNELARQHGLSYTVARRSHPNALPPVGSVIHWKHNHFSSVLGVQTGRMLVEDPNYTQIFSSSLWVTPKALSEEASGFCLVPSQSIGRDWIEVSASEASRIQGAVHWLMGEGDSLTDCDKQACQNNCPTPGMAVYSAHLLKVSLRMIDIPLSYTPPYGPAVQFRAVYNQRDSKSQAAPAYSNLGAQWTFDWSTYIEQDETPGVQRPALVARYVGGGGVLMHSRRSDNQTNYNRDIDGQVLSWNQPANRYQLLAPDGSQLFFGRQVGSSPTRFFLTAVVDPAGKQVTLQYDSSGRLSTITDALGHVTTLYHELTGANNRSFKITRISDPFLREAKFTYDAMGRLKSIEDPVGMVSAFSYSRLDDPNFITSMSTPYGTSHFSYWEDASTGERWLLMTDPLGGQEKVHYVPATPDWPQESPPSLPVNVTVACPPADRVSDLGSRNTFYVTKKAMPSYLRAANYSQCAQVYHWGQISASSPLPSRILESYKPPLGSRVWIYYPGQTSDCYGASATLRKPSMIARLVESESGASPTTQSLRMEYNDLGIPTRIIDPLGRETIVTYHENKIDLNQVYQNYSGTQHLLISVTNYTTFHTPTRVIDGANCSYYFGWNNEGQLQTITNPSNQITTIEYTEGYLTRVHRENGITNTFTYDTAGRVRSVTNANNYWVTYDYDKLNRITNVAFPDGTQERHEYTRLDLTRVWDRQNNRTDISYDDLGRPLKVVDPDGRITRLSWCGCGGLESVVDPRQQITSWTYDIEGRLVYKTYQDTRSESFTYEPLSGRLSSATDSKGQGKQYRYRVDDALRSVTHNGGGAPNLTLSYDDLYGRLTSVVSTVSGGSVSFGYHPPGVLGAGRLAFEDPGDQGDNDRISYTYDHLGQVRTRSVNSTITAYTYDDLGRPKEHITPLGTFVYGFDGSTPRLQTITYPPGSGSLAVNFSYLDNLGGQRLSGIENKLNNSTVVSKFSYRYDHAGRIREWIQQVGTASTTSLTNIYDRSGQLLDQIVGSQTGPIRAYAYAYDAAGNRTAEQIDVLNLPTRVATVSSNVYNPVNQLSSRSGSGQLPVRFAGYLDEHGTVTVGTETAHMTQDPDGVAGRTWFSADLTLAAGSHTVTIAATDLGNHVKSENYQINVTGAPDVAFSYDFNGNCESMTVAGVTTTYGWDAEDRLVQITKGNETTEIAYDAFSRWRTITEKTGGVTTSTKHFLWAGLQLIEERNGTGTTTKRFFPNGVQVGSANYFYTRDHLGSVREVIDSTGAVAARYDYDPYGRRTRTAGSTDFDFGFTGHYFHARSGLYLAPFRAYDANLGRWINRDPIGERGGLNLYGYVGNSPVGRVDSAGLSWLGDYLEDVGKGIYDSMMGDTPGQYNRYSKGAMDAEMGVVDIDRNDNVLRDSMGQGARTLGDLGEEAAKTYAGGKLAGLFGAACGRVGRLGSPAHRAVVDDIVAHAVARDLEYVKEFMFPAPGIFGSIFGAKFADVVVFDAAGNIAEIYQVGRVTAGGWPVARELVNGAIIAERALMDVIFVPYNLP